MTDETPTPAPAPVEPAIDAKPWGPAPVITKAFPYPDGKRVLLILDSGARVAHELGGRLDQRMEEAYQAFLKAQPSTGA